MKLLGHKKTRYRHDTGNYQDIENFHWCEAKVNHPREGRDLPECPHALTNPPWYCTGLRDAQHSTSSKVVLVSAMCGLRKNLCGFGSATFYRM